MIKTGKSNFCRTSLPAVVIGLGVGIAMAVALKDVAVGVAIGAGVALSFRMANRRWNK